MAYYNNTTQKTRPIRALVNSGADLMKNMYDIKIYFPSDNIGKTTADTSFNQYPITARATGFDIPDVEVPTYEIKYHGITVKKPRTEIQMERSFTLTFREDAFLGLRARFTNWHMAVADPVTGGVSNSVSYFGKVEVATITGEYYSRTVANPTENETSIEQADGLLTDTSGSGSGLARLGFWAFYNVWVSKVTSPKFSTEDASANTFDVTFNFMDYDAPFYGDNSLDSALAGWSAEV